jgi:hypothetical protein
LAAAWWSRLLQKQTNNQAPKQKLQQATKMNNTVDLRVDFSLADTDWSKYEAIARSVLATGHSHVLAFHDTDSAARSFANEDEFRRAFKDITAREFPHMRRRYMNVRTAFVSARAGPGDRRDIFDAFANCPDDEVFLMTTCPTIGEGIDVAIANHLAWATTKGCMSRLEIVHNVYRLSSREGRSTMTFPCVVDKTKFEAFGGDPELCGKEIQRQMASGSGGFEQIMEAFAALKEEEEKELKPPMSCWLECPVFCPNIKNVGRLVGRRHEDAEEEPSISVDNDVALQLSLN